MKGWNKAYAIDANVILRFLLRDHPELSPKAKAIISAVENGDLAVVCDPVQLAEVAWTLRSSYKLDTAQVAASLGHILSLDGFIVPDKDRYIHALQLSISSTGGYGDACACALAMTECEGRLLSFDKKLSNVPGLERLEEL